MKNFLIILLILSIPFQVFSEDPIYDTRGDKGNAPVHGRDGTYAGEDGGDAIAPTDAKDSGEITLNIKEVETSDGKVKFQISGNMRNPDGTIKQDFEHLFEIDNDGYILTDHTGLTDHVQTIKTDSSGTTAHDGGEGGGGAKGRKGTRGSDATRYSWGTDGGQGGRGGTAGEGTDSAQSGDAAKTTVNIDEDQTHLLMHIDEDSAGVLDGVIEGGEATQAGVHGAPGAGGEGGEGGSSYSWTTTETYSTTDSEGKSVTRTRTRHHHNPGGSRGPRGPEGYRQTSVLKGKPKGKDAKFVVNIKKKDGQVQTYTNGRYDLKIVQNAKYKSAAAHGGIVDGIIEPNEMVEVRYTVQNTSTMPTPKRVAHLAVLDSQGVRQTDVTRLVEIPSLQPGEIFVTEAVFVEANSSIRLPVKGDAIVEKGVLNPRVTQSGTSGENGEDKVYKRATNQTGFEIQQVVKLDDEVDIRGTSSLVPGKEETWLEIDLINNSRTQGVGINASIPRELSTRQQFLEEDGLTAKDIIAYDENGKQIELTEAIKTEHAKLGPGEKKTLKLKIGIRERQEPYTSGNLRTVLSRGELDNLLQGQDIQIQDFKVQAVKTFDAYKKPDIVLITNQNTTKDSVEAYKKEMLEKFGKVVEDYNISYYSALDLEKPPLKGLDVSETTFMVLNNEYGPEGNQAANKLKLNDTLKAIHEKGANIMFVGPGSPGTDLANRLSPAGENLENLEVKQHESSSDYAKSHKRGEATTANVTSGEGDTIQVRERFVRGETTDKKMLKEAEKQAASLNEVDPQGRYVVVTTPGNDGSKPAEGTWNEIKRQFKNFFSNRPVGSYTILRTSDVNESGVSHLKVSGEQINSPEFVKSYDFQLAYLKQLTFEEKLEILDSLSIKDFRKNSAEKALYNSILSDLAEEQSLVKSAGKGKLKKLEKLSQYKFKNNLNATGGKFEFFTEMLADLYHMGKVSKKGFFDSIYKQTMVHLDALIDNETLINDSRTTDISKKVNTEVESKLKERQLNLAEMRAENKETIKLARAKRNESLGFFSKIFSFAMDDPELDANGKSLQESLHPVIDRTFIIDAHIQTGTGIDRGRNIMPDNVVVSVDDYNVDYLSRGQYDQAVDEKVAFEQVSRASNTGRDVDSVKSIHPAKPVNHNLKCLLRELSL